MKAFDNLSSLAILIFLGIFSSCTKNEVTNITLNKSSANYTIGQKDSLISTLKVAGDVSKFPLIWTTSNSTVATVKNGLITAINTGTATITVKSGTQMAMCKIIIDDKINPSLTKGLLIYYGDVYETKTDTILNNNSNNFIIYLGGATVNLNNYFAGSDDRLMIEVNVPTIFNDSIPSGTYDMMTDLKQSEFVPFSIVPAYIDKKNEPWGSWDFGLGSNPIEVGNMVVKESMGIYNIEYVFIDYYGNTISGTYNGSLSYFNNTTQNAPAILKNKMQFNSSKILTKLSKLKNRKL